MESVVPAMATNGQPGLFPPWNVPPSYPVAQSTAAFPDERWGPGPPPSGEGGGPGPGPGPQVVHHPDGDGAESKEATEGCPYFLQLGAPAGSSLNQWSG